MKKLPSIFANSGNIKDNNEKIYMTGGNGEKIDSIDTNSVDIVKTVKQKINNIMRLKNNSYKIPVNITTKDGTSLKYIIGKNSKNIITIENELIKIDDIIDIEKSE